MRRARNLTWILENLEELHLWLSFWEGWDRLLGSICVLGEKQRSKEIYEQKDIALRRQRGTK